MCFSHIFLDISLHTLYANHTVIYTKPEYYIYYIWNKYFKNNNVPYSGLLNGGLML